MESDARGPVPSYPELGEILDRAPGGFISFADDGTILAANHTIAARLGYEASELIGKHVEMLFSLPTRLFYQTHFFPLLRLQGYAQEIFLLMRTSAGESAGMLCSATRRDLASGSATECVLLEVQERRKYEAALLEAKRLAESAAVRIAEQATELEVQQEQLQEQTTELEMQHQQLQEQTMELEMQADALQSLNAELTARSEELERARGEAEHASRAKSDFLATMSHELRTPLNAIGGYTELLETGIYGNVTDEQREALHRITRSQRHLLGLINDILNLARVEAGRIDYTIVDVEMREVVAELAVMIEPQMSAKGLMYGVELPEEALIVRADREKLVQILLNLLSNAVKFTASNGRVTLRCARTNAGVRIDVIDTGRGIPSDRIDAVFEPFVQVRSDATAAKEGTGLGLAIARNLARGMGGDLSATSDVGKGSTFSLTLLAAS